MARLIEEIILKVGIDAATLNASLAQISKRLDTFSKKVNKLGDTTGKLDGALDKAGDQATKDYTQTKPKAVCVISGALAVAIRPWRCGP